MILINFSILSYYTKVEFESMLKIWEILMLLCKNNIGYKVSKKLEYYLCPKLD